AGLGAAELDSDDGLLVLLRHLQRAHELAPFAEAFEINLDRRGAGILGDKSEAVGHVDIGFVAGSDAVAVRKVAIERHAMHMAAERWAVGDDAEFSAGLAAERKRRVEAHVEAGREIHEADAVRSHDADAGRAPDRRNALLLARALLVDFGKARAEDDD